MASRRAMPWLRTGGRDGRRRAFCGRRPTLREETNPITRMAVSQGKKSKRAASVLLNTLLNSVNTDGRDGAGTAAQTNFALPLLILIAQQKTSILYGAALRQSGVALHQTPA